MIGLTSPPLLTYIGIRIARMKKMHFVYWTMDLQPELSVVAEYMKEGSSMARTIQKRGDYIFRHSDRIIVLDSYMKQHICRRLHSDRKGIDVIPVWPVMESVYEGKREDNPFRRENGFGNRIVIMYSSNHSVMHPLTTLLEAAVRLKDDERFLFVHILLKALNILTVPLKRSLIRQKGIQNSKRFSWDKMCNEVALLYKEALDNCRV